MRKDNYAVSIHARMGTVWRILREKAEHPEKYLPGIDATRILERYPDGLLREIETRGLTIRERITFLEEGEGRIVRYRLVDHPLMSGTVDYRLSPTGRDSATPVTPATLNLVIDWVPRDDEAETEVLRDMDEAMQRSLQTIREEAEEADRE
jgi:hypothetical protein